MNIKNMITLIAMLIFTVSLHSFAAGENVNNYFQQAGSGKENTLVIGGVENVSGTLNVSGTENVSGILNVTGTANLSGTTAFTGDLTVSSITVTNTAEVGTLTDGTASLTGGTATGLLDITSSSGTITNLLTCGTIDTGQGATEVYAMDQDVQTTDTVTFSSGTITNAFKAKSLAPTGSYTGAELQALTPDWVQQMAINSDVNEIYVSTGTSSGQWVAIKDYTTTP